MNKKKNSLPRKQAWKRFYEGIVRLRADIKSGVTTADTFKVEDYFVTNYGRYDLEPLLRSKKEPDERSCTLFMYFYNRFKNKEARRRSQKQRVFEYSIEFNELDEDKCIKFLKERGYKILKPRPTEYDEV
jgi:hypothetical protein